MQALADRGSPTLVYATITRTSLVDAVPITPTSAMPTIPAGSYKILLSEPTVSRRDCILDPAQQNAWGCNRGAVMQLNINTGRDQIEATFSNIDDDSNDFTRGVRYGVHPPEISEFVSMELMDATDHKDEGPAYVFHQSFHKVVVLSENDFPPPILARRLSLEGFDHGISLNKREPIGWSSAKYAQFGEKPWFCFWNDTLIEGFVFVNSNTTAATDSAALANTTTVLSEAVRATEITGQTSIAMSATLLVEDHDSSDNDTFSTAKALLSRAVVIDDLEHYTKLVKIEERRNWDNPIPPYCQQMLIHEDGIARPTTGEGESRVELHVEETNKFPRASNADRRRGWFGKLSNLEKRSSDSLSACGCAWFSR